jgi:hypothetical protein
MRGAVFSPRFWPSSRKPLEDIRKPQSAAIRAVGNMIEHTRRRITVLSGNVERRTRFEVANTNTANECLPLQDTGSLQQLALEVHPCFQLDP